MWRGESWRSLVGLVGTGQGVAGMASYGGDTRGKARSGTVQYGGAWQARMG